MKNIKMEKVNLKGEIALVQLAGQEIDAILKKYGLQMRIEPIIKLIPQENVPKV